MRFKTPIIVLTTLFSVVLLTRSAVPQAVFIRDVNLRATIIKSLNKKSDKAAITESDLRSLTKLSAQDIYDFGLTGLEHATNLTELSVSGARRLSPRSSMPFTPKLDVARLKNLTQLTTLTITHANLRNVSLLKNLKNLTTLNLIDCGMKGYCLLKTS